MSKAQGQQLIEKNDLTGRRFGSLIVKKRLPNTPKDRVWECECDCGAAIKVLGGNLKKKYADPRTPSCLECSFQRKRVYSNSVVAYRYCVYQFNARKSGWPFKITYECFEELLRGDCFYCGALPQLLIRNWGVRRYAAHNQAEVNGIDRIDSSLGYIEGNLVSCCYLCNRAKMEDSAEQFLDHARRVAIHQGWIKEAPDAGNG